MNSSRWNFILFNWIKETKLADVTTGFEGVDVVMFFDKFSHIIQNIEPSLVGKSSDMFSFLSEKFRYEPSITGDCNESFTSEDKISIFSLLLYYSCVVKVSQFFQECCKSLSTEDQSIIFTFFGVIKQAYENNEPVTQSIIAQAIQKAAPASPQFKFLSSSPMKTPDKFTPSNTPSKFISHEKLMELKFLKTQLENERYERNLVETELKESEEIIARLQNEKQTMKQELLKQKTEQITSMNNENLSPNKAIREEQIRIRLQKDINSREEEIITLRCQVDQLEAKLAKKENRVAAMDREVRENREKSRELEDFLDELKSDILIKDQKIMSLEETARELQSFINETRSSVARDSSSDCLDMSFSTSNTAGNSSDGGENLAKYVIEVQLKEKEAENQQLQDLLLTSSEEKERLRAALTSRDKTIESMQKSVTKMKNEIKEQMAAVSSQLKTAQEARKEFEQLLESEKRKFEELRQQEDQSRLQIVDSLRVEIEQKSKDLQEKTQDLSLLRQDHEKEIQKLNKNKKILIEKMTKSKDASFIKMESDFSMKVKKAEDERDEVVKRLEQLISVHEKNIESLKKLAEDTEVSNSNLTSTLSERDQTIDQITLEKEKLLKKLTSAQEELQVTHKATETKAADINVEITHLKKTQDEEVGKILSQKFVIENQLLEKTREMDHLTKQSAQEQNDLKEQIKTCNDKITEVRDEKEKLQQIIDSLQKQIDEKCSQHELVMEKLCEEVSKTSSTAEEIQELKMKMQQREVSIADDLKKLQIKLNDKDETMSAQTKQTEDAQKLLEKVQSEVKSVNEELVKKVEENSHLKLQMVDMQELSEKSLETISHLQAEVEKEKQECQYALEKLERDASSHVNEIEELKNKLQQQETAMTDEYKHIEEELQKKNETLQIVSMQKKEMQTLVEELNIEMDIMKTDFEKQVEENSRLKHDIDDHELQIENIELQNLLLFEEKESVIRLKAIAEKDLQTLKESLITKSAEVERLKAEILDQSSKISNTEKCNENLRVELKDVNERINSERDQVKILEQKVQENEELVNVLHMSVDELKDSNTKFELGLKVIENEHEILLSSLNEKHSNALKDLSASKVLISELETKEKVLKEAVQKNAKIKVEFEVLQTQHEILQERSRGLEATIASTNEDNALLKAEIESNSKKIHDLSNENNQKSSDLREKLREQEEKIQQQTLKIEDTNTKIKAENNSAQITKNTQDKEIQEMRNSVLEKENTILEMVSQIDELKTIYREQVNGLEKQLETSSSNDSARVQELLKKLEAQKDIEKKLQALEEAHTKEQIFNNKMQEENQIVLAKLMKARAAQEEQKKVFDIENKKLQLKNNEIKLKSDEEIKEVRLELEGKLEKMKEKMRSLYNDEMLKKTQKYDEKLTEHRETINMMEIKLTQFEQHNEKLAKQNHLTSEMKLKYEEMVKENEFMRSKIRFMEINGGMQIKNSVGINRMQSSMAQINGASLGMEDEPGEEFNNTYLKDLKRGGSEVSLDLYSTSELQKRNSMYPQHMRGSYAMLGMDRTIGEQEMKDGGSQFDDSHTALLQGVNRKKQTTSYKRPGPPTPSKMGGRLSIGGASIGGVSSDQNILKDSTNSIDAAVSKKTPNTNRLRSIFSSSSSKFKDENGKSSPRRLSFFRNKK